MPTLLLGHFFHCKRGGLIRRGQQNIKMYILISISCQKRALSNLVLPQQSEGTLKMGDRLVLFIIIIIIFNLNCLCNIVILCMSLKIKQNTLLNQNCVA